MALNVSNVLLLMVQQMKRKQLVHITTLKINHIKLACVYCRKFLRNRFLKIIYAMIQNVLC